MLFVTALAGSTAVACPPSLLSTIESPAGGVGDNFGYSIALIGDVLLVGAPLDDTLGEDAGAVYVYRLIGGEWTADGMIVPTQADEPHAGDHFGSCIVYDRQFQRLVIGAPADDETGADRGAAFVFERDPSGLWIDSTKITTDHGLNTGSFGLSGAILGDTLVIGAPFSDNEWGGTVGTVYLYERTAEGAWTMILRLTTAAVPDGGLFGSNLAISNDTLAVAAPFVGGEFSPGQVFTYKKADGYWSFERELRALMPIPGDHFGGALVLDGDTLFVGAPKESPAPLGFVNTIVHYGLGEWEHAQVVLPDQSSYLDRFGGAIAVDRDRVLVGASGYEGHGCAYLFTRDGAILTQLAQIEIPDAELVDLHGCEVALQLNLAVIGAPGDDIGGAVDTGSISLWDLTDADLDDDGDVDVQDLLIVIANWGQDPTSHTGDVDRNGQIAVGDLLVVLSRWGSC